MSTFNGLIISGEGCHGHFIRGDCSRVLVQNKDQFLWGCALVSVKKSKEHAMWFVLFQEYRLRLGMSPLWISFFFKPIHKKGYCQRGYLKDRENKTKIES